MIRRLGIGKNVARGFSTAEQKTSRKITIQPAVERSPTDLLKALSEKVGVDPTAPHFAFIDDPITIPSTTTAKKTYFMARELGKRVARELATEWPTLFAFDRDQPRLPVFRPQPLADPLKVEPTEENLLSMIESREVQDCCMLYERMRSENIEISEETQLELFRLVSYYNSTNIPFAEWTEWSGMRNFGDDNVSHWKIAGVADLLFESLTQTDETVSIMISGLCKFPSEQSVKRAKQLYKEHLEKKGSIKMEAFNGLISVSNYKVAKTLCSEMSKCQIRPEISTFEALLNSASKFPKFEERVNAFSEIIGEMDAQNIEPSLSCYYLILKKLVDPKYFNEDRKKDEETEKKYKAELTLAISWISQIIDRISSKSLEVKSTKCNLFFAEAMGIAYRTANLNIAQKLLNVYESSNNNVKMPAFTIESMFYNRYIQLFIEQSSSIEEIVKVYKNFVPRLVGVSNSLSSLVYRKLARQPHWPLLRRVIEDGICAGQLNSMLGDEMRRQLINVQYHTLSVNERDEFSELVQKMVAVWEEFSKFTEEHSKRMQRKLSPIQISECALLLTRIGEYQKAYELLELLLDEEASHGEEATVMARGFARQTAMAELFEEALRRKDSYCAAICLEIMALTNNRNKLEPLANRIFERCTLTESQKKIIEGFVRLRPQ